MATAMLNLSSSDTEKKFQVGDIVEQNGERFEYVCFAGTQAAGDFVTITDGTVATVDYPAVATSGTTTTAGAIPQRAGLVLFATTVGQFGWVARKWINRGISALTLCAANVKCYTTATAGSIDDSATTLVRGVVLRTTVGGATAVTLSDCVVDCAVNCS